MYAFSMKTIGVFDGCSVDDKRKRIKKYALSNENALVWTEPKTALSHIQAWPAPKSGLVSLAEPLKNWLN